MKYLFTLKNILFLCVILLAFFLRFYNVSNNPPGLYIDEVSIGNNAHAILTTGKDEYGVSHPLFFRAFGEYKLPVLIYITALSLGIFGHTEFAIRFPSLLFGTLTVVLLYFFIKDLIKLGNLQKEKLYKYLPLTTAFFLAISPWHIQFSRGGFEVNLAVFFYLFGLYFVFKYLQKKVVFYLFVAFLLFCITIYTYFVYRIITPVTILVVLVMLLYKKKINWKQAVGLSIFTTFILLPSIIFSFSKEGMMRFSQTSAFGEYAIKGTFEKFYMYPMIYIKNYLSYFSIPYFFVTGDGIGRHQMPWFGIAPLAHLPFFLAGVFMFLRKKNVISKLILGLLLASPLAAAFAVPSPHTLRNLLMVIPITLLISIGFLYLWQSKKKLVKLGTYAVLGVMCIEYGIWIHFYNVHYPKVNALDWGGAYKEVVLEASALQKNYAAIIIDNRLGYAGNYFTFYDPSLPILVIDDSWKQPTELEGKKILFIRPYGIASGGKHVKTIHFPQSVNNDIFAEFWEL